MSTGKKKPKTTAGYNLAEKIRGYLSIKGLTIIIDGDFITEDAKFTPFSYNSKDKILILVPNKLNEREPYLLSEVIQHIFDQDDLIIKRERLKVLENYKKYKVRNRSDDTILAFFMDKLSPDDYDALKMSLFLRNEQRQGRNVSEYKRDIRDRFGERGANIANLCTAGYFENEFMPLYELSHEEFKEFYNLAVEKKARALFVHSYMTIEELQVQFDEMVEKGFKYHMTDFRIHGIGEANVVKVKRFFEERRKDENERFTCARTLDKNRAIEYNIILTR